VRGGEAELDGVLVVRLEEGPHAAGVERPGEPALAEGGLVVSVEDTAQDLEVEGQEVRHPRAFRALLDQTVLAEEPHEDPGPIGPGQIVVVDDVGVPEARAHLAELRLGAPGEGEQRDGGLGERDAGVGARRVLAGLDAHLGARVGIHLAEQLELDLAREEAVLAPGEGARARLRDVALGQVADEIPRHAHVEEELTGSALPVERERLARPHEVLRREGGRRRWCLRGHGRGRRRRGLDGRGRGRRGRRGRGGRRGCGLQLLEPLGEARGASPVPASTSRRHRRGPARRAPATVRVHTASTMRA